MAFKIKILAISGSTRSSSSNLYLIQAIAALTTAIADIKIFEGLTAIPHFNPDLDNDTPPGEVTRFRQAVRAADAVLICTPEYAVGVPGTLKNAIDWTVSSMEFSQRPVILITAGTSGVNAHQSLLGTLLIIESRITREMQLVVSAVKTKVNAAAEITDDATLQNIRAMIYALQEVIAGNVGEEAFLRPPAFF